MIYLDYSANTPVDPAVLDIYCKTELAYIANPNSTHCAGQAARAEMARVTESIASQLGVQPAEIIYTSGASEANNLAIKGIAQASRHIGKHIISTQLEHSSVGASLSVLQQQGYEIDLLNVNRDGKADLAQLRELLRKGYDSCRRLCRGQRDRHCAACQRDCRDRQAVPGLPPACGCHPGCG